jgi:hypothetical protein
MYSGFIQPNTKSQKEITQTTAKLWPRRIFTSFGVDAQFKPLLSPCMPPAATKMLQLMIKLGAVDSSPTWRNFSPSDSQKVRVCGSFQTRLKSLQTLSFPKPEIK